MSYDRAEYASSKFVNAMGIRRMYSLLERIFDRSAHLPTISMARHMMNWTHLPRRRRHRRRHHQYQYQCFFVERTEPWDFLITSGLSLHQFSAHRHARIEIEVMTSFPRSVCIPVTPGNRAHARFCL